MRGRWLVPDRIAPTSDDAYVIRDQERVAKVEYWVWYIDQRVLAINRHIARLEGRWPQPRGRTDDQ